MAVTTITKVGAFSDDVATQINDNFTSLSASTAGGTLTSAHLLVGSGSNVATDVALSGDATLANTGAITVVSLGGKKIARSASPAAVTGTLDIDTGLATVVSVTVSASSDLDGTNLAGVSAVITGTAGHFTAKCWKITAADNGALIAATGAKNVNWIAVGT